VGFPFLFGYSIFPVGPRFPGPGPGALANSHRPPVFALPLQIVFCPLFSLRARFVPPRSSRRKAVVALALDHRLRGLFREISLLTLVFRGLFSPKAILVLGCRRGFSTMAARGDFGRAASAQMILRGRNIVRIFPAQSSLLFRVPLFLP